MKGTACSRSGYAVPLFAVSVIYAFAALFDFLFFRAILTARFAA